MVIKKVNMEEEIDTKYKPLFHFEFSFFALFYFVVCVCEWVGLCFCFLAFFVVFFVARFVEICLLHVYRNIT